MVPKGSTPPLAYYDPSQIMSLAYYQGMRLPFPPILPLVFDSMVTLDPSPLLEHLYYGRPALERDLKEHLADMPTMMAIDIIEGSEEVELFQGGELVPVWSETTMQSM